MRRFLPVVILALVLLIPSLAWSESGDSRSQSGVKMVVLSKNGEKIAYKIINYEIFQFRGKWAAVWEEVKWFKRNEMVALIPHHWSTAEGGITNLTVGKDFATFDMGVGGSIRVIIRQPDKYLQTADIKAVAVYPDVTEEWEVTNDRIYLPSKEVFGIGAVREKSLKK